MVRWILSLLAAVAVTQAAFAVLEGVVEWLFQQIDNNEKGGGE